MIGIERDLRSAGGEYLRYQVVAVYPDDTWDTLFESDDPREALAEIYRLGALHNLSIEDGGAVAITSDLVRIAGLLGIGPQRSKFLPLPGVGKTKVGGKSFLRSAQQVGARW